MYRCNGKILEICLLNKQFNANWFPVSDGFVCKLMNIWMLWNGIIGFESCYICRLLILYLIFVRELPYSYFKFPLFLLLGVSALPVITWCMLSTIFDATNLVNGKCIWVYGWDIAIICVLAFYYAVLAVIF